MLLPLLGGTLMVEKIENTLFLVKVCFFRDQDKQHCCAGSIHLDPCYCRYMLKGRCQRSSVVTAGTFC